jgi:hypothetical protein
MSEAIPDGFPASSAGVQLALCLVAKRHPDKLVDTVERVYREYWAEGNSKVLTPDGFSAIFEAQLGAENAKHILQEVRDSALLELLVHC